MIQKHSIVTGGAGFIGSHLVDTLLDRGDTVVAVDDISTGSMDNLLPALQNDRFRLIVDDIANVTEANLDLSEDTTIYHLAASVGVEYVTSDPCKTIVNNLNSTRAVLELALGRHIPVFIASSSEVYGDKCYEPHLEDQPLTMGPTGEPRWSYAYSKAVSESLAISYWRDHGLPVVIGRFFNVAGPRQLASLGMVLPKFVDQAIENKPLTVYGDGHQQRCFADVDDVVGNVIALMSRTEAYGQMINIGNDAEISIVDLARLVIDVTGSQSDLRFVTTEEVFKYFVDVDRRVPNLDKMRSILSPAAPITLEKTISKIAAFEQVVLATDRTSD